MTPDQVPRSSMPARASSRERSPRHWSCCGCSRWRSTSVARTWSAPPASSRFGSEPTCGGSSTSALRDLIVVQVFIGSFIFFYPDVVAGQALPITGGLAAVCAFAVLLIKLFRHSDEASAFRWQVLLLGLGATLYIVPYLLGVQMTELHGKNVERLVPMLVTNQNLDVALPLCYLSGWLVGAMGLVAVAYNLRLTGRRPAAPEPEAAR